MEEVTFIANSSHREGGRVCGKLQQPGIDNCSMKMCGHCGKKRHTKKECFEVIGLLEEQSNGGSKNLQQNRGAQG